MSSCDSNSATEASPPLIAESPVVSASDAATSSPTNTKAELDSQALLLLRDFFLLLDEWDEQQKELAQRGLHNVMEPVDFAGKPFPCPVCNMGLRIKISRKQKPYCMCLECGIQIFFRGQKGIRRLFRIIRSEEAVAAEFNGPARAIFLYNRLQGLKRQKKAFEEKRDFFSWHDDADKVIAALDVEIEKIRSELNEETEKHIDAGGQT